MNPYIIIDAWDFEGFSSDCGGKILNGLIGDHVRVKEKGWLNVETSWGLRKFKPGDRIVILDVAAAVSEGGNPIHELNMKFLHELCHWAEDVHRPGREHGQIWNAFLNSLLKETPE